jgi:hypothetical protein
MRQTEAASWAAEQVRAVRDSAEGRLRLAAEFYTADAGHRGRYGRAELTFLRWATARGVLNGPSADKPGSPWWRAVNDALLRDKLESSFLRGGASGDPSTTCGARIRVPLRQILERFRNECPKTLYPSPCTG